MKRGFQLGLYILIFANFALANATASSESFEPVQLRLRLHDQSLVQLFFPEDNPSLQKWIDKKTAAILETPIGRTLCRQVLGANVSTLQAHLAVSSPAAIQIALNCASTIDLHPYVDYYTADHPVKMIKNVAFQKRHYQFLLTENNNWPFDSWTDAATNQTALVLPSQHGKNPDAFLQMLAHEFAVYFDGQYSVGTKDWWSLHSEKNFEIITPDLERLFLAANNPVIASVLSSMRAFQVEKELMQQMHISEVLAQYDEKSFYFLNNQCDHNCLMNFVKAQSMALSPYALALTAYSRNYADKIFRQLEKENSTQLVLFRIAIDRYDRHFIKKSKFSMMPFIAIVESMHSWLPRQILSAVQNLFDNEILPDDLARLDDARVYLHDSNTTISFLQWILQPTLSGRNVDFSSGPRPRIRTGGGGYGN